MARSFGVSESCLNRWLQVADREDRGSVAGTGAAPELSPEQVRELLKRNKQLEQENEILRRATAYFARDTLPK